MTQAKALPVPRTLQSKCWPWGPGNLPGLASGGGLSVPVSCSEFWLLQSCPLKNYVDLTPCGLGLPLPQSCPQSRPGPLSLPFPPRLGSRVHLRLRKGLTWNDSQKCGTLSKKRLTFPTGDDSFIREGVLVCLCVFPYVFLNKSKPCS